MAKQNYDLTIKASGTLVKLHVVTRRCIWGSDRTTQFDCSVRALSKSSLNVFEVLFKLVECSALDKLVLDKETHRHCLSLGSCWSPKWLWKFVCLSNTDSHNRTIVHRLINSYLPANIFLFLWWSFNILSKRTKQWTRTRKQHSWFRTIPGNIKPQLEGTDQFPFTSYFQSMFFFIQKYLSTSTYNIWITF